MITEPPVRFEALPRVTTQLPLYNERYVVERLVEETLKMNYPRELLQIQVLDDSTDETHPLRKLWLLAIRHWATRSSTGIAAAATVTRQALFRKACGTLQAS